MTKEELIYITLKQLNNNFSTTPENFRFEDSSASSGGNNSNWGPTIIWQFRVKIEEDRYIPDPLNSIKTIIVSYNTMAKQLTCSIYSREINSSSSLIAPDVQASIRYSEYSHPILYRTYRQFSRLNNSIKKKKNEKEFLDYMNKLNQIFPTTGIDDIFE